MLESGDTRRIIITDKTWQTRKANEAWVAAKELHPHGAGPWGAILNPKARLTAQNGDAPPVRAALVQNDFLMRSLGRPHRDQVVTTRPSELTTLQAIDLANGDILAGYLKTGAQRLRAESRPSEELVVWLYQHALSREPTDREQAVLLELLGDGRDSNAIEDLLWAVIMLPEFQIVQ